MIVNLIQQLIRLCMKLRVKISISTLLCDTLEMFKCVYLNHFFKLLLSVEGEEQMLYNIIDHILFFRRDVFSSIRTYVLRNPSKRDWCTLFHIMWSNLRHFLGLFFLIQSRFRLSIYELIRYVDWHVCLWEALNISDCLGCLKTKIFLLGFSGVACLTMLRPPWQWHIDG